MINSQKRHLLSSIVRGNQYFLPLGCWMDLKLFLRIWPRTFKKKFLAGHSSSGVCNHQGIFIAATGIKMVAVC